MLPIWLWKSTLDYAFSKSCEKGGLQSNGRRVLGRHRIFNPAFSDGEIQKNVIINGAIRKFDNQFDSVGKSVDEALHCGSDTLEGQRRRSFNLFSISFDKRGKKLISHLS